MKLSIKAELADGTVLEFPDGTAPEVIRAAAQRTTLGQSKEEHKAEYLRGLNQSVAQGVSLGFSDEITGLLVAGAAEIKDILTPGNDGMSFNEVRQDVTQSERDNQRLFAEQNPKTALAAEVGGGVLTGGAGATKVLGTQAVKQLPKTTKYAIGGAIPGAVYGTGAADEGGRLAGAGQGAALGGAFGAGVPMIGSGVWKALSWAAPKVTAAFTTNASKALRNIRQAFDRDGVTVQQAEKNLTELGDQATLGDIGGPNVTLIAEDLANQPGAALTQAKKVLGERGKGQGNRIIEMVRSKLSTNADDIMEAADEIRTRMRTKAGPLYDEAYATVIEITQPLKELMGNAAVKPLLAKAIKTAKSDETLPAHLKAGLNAENPNMVVWDYVKRELSDKTNKAIRSGGGNKSRIFTGIEKKLVKELDRQAPAYGKARKIWSDNSDQLDALEKGTNVFRSLNKDADFTISEFNKMPQDQQELFRLGAAKTIMNMVRKADDTLEGMPPASMMKSIFGSPAKREVLKTIFPGEGEFKQFAKLMKAEGVFHKNSNQILANSRTAVRQAARQDGSVDPAVAGDIANLATGDVRGGLNILRRFTQGGRKSNPEVDAEMAQRFFTKDAEVIKDTLRGIQTQKNILPKWAQSVLKMKPDNMESWLGQPQNRQKLKNLFSGGTGATAVAASH